MELALTLGVAAVVFASTNVDDLFVLLAFFASPQFRARDVVVGQFVGIAALFAASAVLSLVSLVVPEAWIGLLGFAPILIGLKKLHELWRGGSEDADGAPPDASRPGLRALTVAAVTMANGGDNIGVYTPMFATMSFAQLALTGLVFAAMTLLWCGVSHRMVAHPTLGGPIRRYGHRVVPFVLIGLGLLILHEAGSFGLLAG